MPDSSPPALGSALQPVVRRLVRDALERGPGGTLPTNAAYLDDHGMGAGTIQRAIGLLQDQGAVRLVSRGQLGRVIENVDVGQAWRIAALEPVRLLLPPGGAAEIDALEELLAEGLTELGIPHTVRHRGGGAGRLASVAVGEHDVAVVSAGAVAGSDASRLSRVLADGSYYGPGRLVVVRRAQPSGEATAVPQRIAIDSRSADHVALTRAEFSDAAALIETRFPRVPAAVLRGDVDAGIWHVSESVIPLDLAGLVSRPLEHPAALTCARELSAAVLVGWPGRPELRAVLDAVDLSQLAARQQEWVQRSPDAG